MPKWLQILFAAEGTEGGPTSVASQAEAAPAESAPAPETKPVEAKPAESKPTEAKPAEAKPAEAKPAEAKPEAEPPALFDASKVELPDGFTLESVPEETLKEFSEVVNDQALSPADRGKKLVELHTKSLQAAAEQPYKLWETTQQGWVKEVAADKDLGTGNEKAPLKPEVSSTISKVIDQFGGDKLREALDFTGAGNNPEIIRAFYQMGKLMTEGSYATGKPVAGQPKTAAQIMYPNHPTGAT